MRVLRHFHWPLMATLMNRITGTALALVLLAGCEADPLVEQATGQSESGLCLNCGTPTQILDLPQLENILLTSSQRLFVSGQSNIYEVVRSAEGHSANPLLTDGTGCSGMAETRKHLYALCSGGTGPTDFSGLYALDLEDAAGTLTLIYQLNGMTLPNGMAATTDELYVTDGPIAVEPKIVRLSIDPGNPLSITQQQTWLNTLPEFPNGLTYREGALYSTFYLPGVSGRVVRIDIQDDGSPASAIELAQRDIMDDLNFFEDTLLVTDWQSSALFQISLDGELLQETTPFRYAQPSSVTVAGAPLFDQPLLLVTERYTGNGLWASPAFDSPATRR